MAHLPALDWKNLAISSIAFPFASFLAKVVVAIPFANLFVNYVSADIDVWLGVIVGDSVAALGCGFLLGRRSTRYPIWSGAGFACIIVLYRALRPGMDPFPAGALTLLCVSIAVAGMFGTARGAASHGA